MKTMKNKRLLPNHKDALIYKTFSVLFLFFLFAVSVSAQIEQSAKRGLQNGASYSISDIETVNNTNGNVMVSIPVASLPLGRGGSSASIGLFYNSNLWDVQSPPGFEQPQNYQWDTLTSPRALLKSEDGGWRYGVGFKLEQKTRPFISPQQVPCWGENQPKGQVVNYYKFKMVFPDGSAHEFEPSEYPAFLINNPEPDGYYPVDLNGAYRKYKDVYNPIDGMWVTCEIENVSYVDGMNFHTTDGTNIRLYVAHDNDSDPTNNYWIMRMPDGSRVTGNEPISGGGFAEQRIYDKNGNYTEITTIRPSGSSEIITISDQLGREIIIDKDLSTDTDTITSKGLAGQSLVWTIKWTTIRVSRQYQMGDPIVFPNPGTATNTFRLIEEIILPSQLGGRSYKFEYNGSNPGAGGYTYGFGEIKQIETPAGAVASYEYKLDGMQGNIESWYDTFHNPLTKRTVVYDSEYNGSAGSISEVTEYNITREQSVITGPDGSVSKAWYPDVLVEENGGIISKSESPDGTITNKVFVHSTSAVANKAWERLISQEFTTIRDDSGNPHLTAIKTFDYDLNGNLIRTKEYDWVSYTSVTSDGINFAVPGSTLPIRTVQNSFFNSTPEINSNPVQIHSNEYRKLTAPRILNAVRSTEIKNAAGTPFGRSEFFYDDLTTKGNLTETKVWDSFKGGNAQSFSNPLTGTNSISTFADYDQYGNVIKTTDAKGTETVFTYGNITTPTGTVSGLYPTQTVAAYGTGLARTSTATYDFYTGLPLTTTDVDNNLTTATEYDALGRPIKVLNAYGTPLESWTTSEYSDADRRIIVRSDLETKGDGRKVAIQHFDQMGRVRLVRTLEDASVEDPYNETHGIKVETRYRYDNGANPTLSNGAYTLTSNPFRAPTATAATDEPTMGWTLGYADKSGRHSEVTTYAGAALPAAFGGANINSMGTVKIDVDANTTTVIDQAGKKRRSVTNALGQLVRVDEPDGSGNLGTVASPNQPTSYSYDTLDNLVTVHQGVQTRTFAYNSLSRLMSATNPESGTITYSYDANGNLTGKTDARGVSTTITYDALNRATFKNYSDSTPDITYTYDDPAVPFSKGKLTKTASTVSESSILAYDVQERVISSRQRTDGTNYDFAYTYNLDDDLTSQTYPSGKVVNFAYDSSGDLSSVDGANRIYANSFSYAPHGQVEKVRLGNGKWETTKFNAERQITEISLGNSDGNAGLWKVNYEYGELQQNGTIDAVKNNGNLARQTISVPTIGAATGFTATQNYTYDPLDRIKSASEYISGNQSWKQTFNFDRFGNRSFDAANTSLQSSDSAIPKVTNPEIQPSNNKLKEDQDNDGQPDYLYDLSGNLIKDAKGQQFTYNAENLQTTATGNWLSMQYSYDGNNKRIKSHNAITDQTTIFVYDADGDLAAEYTVNVPAPTSPTISYLTEDALGSVRVTTNSSGDIKARRDFLPFGEELYAGLANRNTNQKYSASSDDTRKKFATYQRDVETGLDFAQSRYYSAMHGRFTSPDEFKGGPDELFDFEEDASDNPTFYADLENPQSLNKYQYGYNNPYKYNDPTGHCPLGVCVWGPPASRLADALTKTAIGGAIAATAAAAGEQIVEGVEAVGREVARSIRASANEGWADPSCKGCMASQRMGQRLMNESAKPQTETSNGQGNGKNSATGVTASGRKTNAKGQPLGPSGKPMQHAVRPSTRKNAINAVKTQKGSSGSIRHNKDRHNGKRVDTHLHSVDRKGKKIDNKVHVYLPKRNQPPKRNENQ